MTFTDLNETFQGLFQENERVLRDICLPPEDEAYFQGKNFAYECVIEIIEKETGNVA